MTRAQLAFWQRVNRIDVAMLIIETAFSDRERELAAACIGAQFAGH